MKALGSIWGAPMTCSSTTGVWPPCSSGSSPLVVITCPPGIWFGVGPCIAPSCSVLTGLTPMSRRSQAISASSDSPPPPPPEPFMPPPALPKPGSRLKPFSPPAAALAAPPSRLAVPGGAPKPAAGAACMP